MPLVISASMKLRGTFSSSDAVSSAWCAIVPLLLLHLLDLLDALGGLGVLLLDRRCAAARSRAIDRSVNVNADADRAHHDQEQHRADRRWCAAALLRSR